MSPLRRTLLAVLALSSLLNVTAQDTADADRAEIEQLVLRFMKDRSFPDWKEHYTGDMRLFAGRPTPGASYYEDKYRAVLRLNDQDETSAAVAVAMVEGENKQSDFYLFLRKEDDGWKLAAVRTFAPPRGTGQMYAALAAKGKDVTKADMRELAIMQALQFSDYGLKETFNSRRERFDRIASTVAKKGIVDIIHGSTRHSRIDKDLWQEVHESGLNYVEQRESGVIDFNAAAFGESAVGYFYVPEGAAPPQATPEEYVLVEPLDGPWYLYRRQ